MAAPVVQTVDQILSDLNPAYTDSINTIGARRQAIADNLVTAKAGLAAEKVQGFNSINNSATARGMSFSGIPLDEQATYLSTKYLPGLASLEQSANEQNLNLDSALASINQERRLKALDIQGNQQSALQTYLQNEQQMQWEREKFAKEQALSYAQLRASRAASTVSPTEAATSIISSALGNDGYVSPTTFNTARKMYVQAGGKASDFAKEFWKYTGVGRYNSNGTFSANGGVNGGNWAAYYYG